MFDDWDPILPAATDTVTADATYTANFVKDPTKWFAIVYNANGGSGSEIRKTSDTGSYLEGQSVILADQGSMALANHTFGGWSPTPGGTAVTGYNVNAADATANVITLYAVWTPVSTTTYTVTYDANAGGDPVTNMPINNGGLANSDYLIPSLTPLRTGYTFTGWRKDETTLLQPGNHFTLTGNVTLTAQWRSNENETTYYNLTVNVVPSEGGSVTGVSTGQYAYLYPAIATAVPASGYKFVGWVLEQETQSVTLMAAVDYTSTVNPYPFTIYGNATLTAYFEKLEVVPPPPIETYTVSYHPNGGTGTVPMDMHRHYRGDRVGLLSGAGLHKGNSVWIGWQLADGTFVSNPLVMPNHDVTLFAVYGPAVPLIPKTGGSASPAGWFMLMGALVLAGFVTFRKRSAAK
jgi:uncharacterized repeat protein (TIGR02543 family)